MATGGKRAWLAAFAAAATVSCAAHAPPAPPPPSEPAVAPAGATPVTPAAGEGTSPPPVSDLGPASAPNLVPPSGSEDRMELSTLLFSRKDAPSLLKERLLLSGIDPHEVGQYLEAYNLRSDIVQFTPDGVAFAPHALEKAFSLRPNQLLQFRFSGQAGKFVFRFTWK